MNPGRHAISALAASCWLCVGCQALFPFGDRPSPGGTGDPCASTRNCEEGLSCEEGQCRAPCDEPACRDEDGDRYVADVDCNDHDAEINPGAVEICGNGIDENCVDDAAGCTDGDLPCDADGDGFLAIAEFLPGCGSDCDDSSASTNPEAFEGCGSNPAEPSACPGCPPASPAGIDDDCDGRIDEGCFPDDLDNDGIPEGEDCDDCNAGVGSGFIEVCGNGLDEDCSGADLPCGPADTDRDGVDAAPTGSDCDDSDARTFPGAPDRCGDDIAQDCAFDVSCDTITDADGDYFASGIDDCNDANPAINPWAPEICDADGVDEDCDGMVNEVEGCVYDPGSETWGPLDYRADANHCGFCRNRCCAGPCTCVGDECDMGVCTCYGSPGCAGDPSSSCCPTGCVDIANDPSNCGACGFECGPGEGCEPTGELCGEGECTCEPEPDGASCVPGEACCAGVGCTNVSIDVANCGECGNDCSGYPRPQGDICAVDGQGDPRCYCGAVGMRCAGDEWCTNVTDPDNSCGCRDLLTDPAHCGDCGNACGVDKICVDGDCVCEARAFSDCEGSCDCATGGAQVCCGGSCYVGECCDDADCSDDANPDCSTTDHRCYCRDEGARCPGDQRCCAGVGCRVMCS